MVSVGSKDRAGFGGVKYYNRQITNVAAGQVDAASTDAVNGSQLYAAYDEIASMGAKLVKHDKDIKCLNIRVDRNVNNIKNNTDAINRHETAINNHTTIINNHEQQLQSHEQTLVDHANVLENHENRIESLERGMTRNVEREIGKAGAANASHAVALP